MKGREAAAEAARIEEAIPADKWTSGPAEPVDPDAAAKRACAVVRTSARSLHALDWERLSAEERYVYRAIVRAVEGGTQ